MKDIFASLPDKPLLRLDEVAAFFNITSRTAHRWYVTGRLSGCNPSGTIRIYRISVIELVEKSDGVIDTERESREKSDGAITTGEKPRRKVISRGIE